MDTQGEISYYTRLSMGMGMMRDVTRLSQSTRDLLDKVLGGEQLSTQSIRGVMANEALTVGTPVRLDNTIVGGLFIAASLNDINTLASEGLRILLPALGIGLILAILLGYFLSLNFIRPLKKATFAIDELAQGKYDVSFTKHADDEIGQLTHNIETLSKKLSEARDAQANLEKMRQNFISDITHELRTPVTIIRGLAEGIRDEVYTEEAIPEASAQIIAESLDMQRLINDLLELSKLEDPDFRIDSQAFEWHQLFSDVLRSARPLALPKQQELHSKIAEGTWKGLGDTQRLKQMFLAVLDNAFKFSGPKSVISFSAATENGTLVIRITDQGPGMSSAQQKELFKRYKKDTLNNPQGNGLGLLIVSRIAQKHGLSIQVTSQEGKGTTFTFKAKV